MRPWEFVCAYHRIWRYRLRTERDEIAYLLKQRLARSTIVDIGANCGAYSYWMHRCAGRAGRVIAFEPQPELTEFLAQLKRSLRLRNLTIVPAALSDCPGRLPLIRPRVHWGAASFHLPPDEDSCDIICVNVVTLDEYFSTSDLPPVSFIKCDVQDHEFQALRGGAKLLASQRPTILVEQSDECFRSGELPRFLTSLGYRGYFFFQRQLVGIDDWTKLRGQIAAPFLNYIYRVPQTQAWRSASA
jgi:FkbM family methyltransferase